MIVFLAKVAYLEELSLHELYAKLVECGFKLSEEDVSCPVAKVTHKKKDDYMTSLEFTEGVYNQPIKMVTIYFQDGSIRNETPLTEANIES